MVNRSSNPNSQVAQTATCLRIHKQVIRKQGMQIKNGVVVKARLFGLIDQQLNSRFVGSALA